MINYDYMRKLWTPRSEPNLTIYERYLGPMLLAGGILLELLGCFVIYKICDIEV